MSKHTSSRTSSMGADHAIKIYLLALEVYRLNLILEAGACIQRVLEVGLAQGKDLDAIAGGGAGGTTRLVDDERAFAEEISRTQGCNAPLFGFCPALAHGDRALADQEKLLARLALTDNDLVPLVTTALHLLGDIGELRRREMVEEVRGAQELADHHRVAQHDVRLDGAVDHVHDAVGELDDAVVVGDHHHRASLLGGQLLKQIDHDPAGVLVERGGRLIGKDQLGPVDEGACHRHALTLAARERLRLVVDAMTQPEALEDFRTAAAHLRRRTLGELHRHLDVFQGAERVEQIVHLENEPDVASHGDEIAALQARQVAAENFDPSGLHRAQRANQGQQGRLPGSGRTGHDDELTRFNLDAVVEQHLVARTTFAKEMTDFVDPHGRPRFLGVEIRHRNNSAGSAASTRLTASKPESTHIPMVRARVPTEMPKVMRNGSSVISPRM